MQFRQIKPKRNFFLLLVTLLCLFLFWSCGVGKSPSEDSASGAGALSFNIVYHDGTDGSLRSRAAKLDCADLGIATVEARVYGPDDQDPAVGGPWNCGDGQGTIFSVPAGSDRTVVVLGKDADENITLRGHKSGITVVADSENNAGTIGCYDFVPDLWAPGDDAVYGQGIVFLEWEPIAGATKYRVLVSQNSDMSNPVIDELTATATFTPSGLASEMTYYWQVFASDSNGNRGSGSQIWSIAITDAAGPLPDTGQDWIDGYMPVPGEDLTYTINPPSYTKLDLNGNDLDAGAEDWAMVRDNVTGLIWEVKTDDDTIHGKDDEYNWQGAQDEFIDELNTSNFGGYADWRLPTVKELAAIVHRGEDTPAINTDYFPNTNPSPDYWSATEAWEDSAWTVVFEYGYVGSNYKTDTYHVRAVRGEQLTGGLVDNQDGTVTDTATGLMWQQSEAGTMTWAEALNYCETLTLADYGDWRLPNINELQSIVDYKLGYQDGEPAIDKTFFPDAGPSLYWSATTFAYSTSEAWKVDFNFGQIQMHVKTDGYYVRAVRHADFVQDD